MKLFHLVDLLKDPTPVPEPLRFHGPAFNAAIGDTSTVKATAALITLPAGSQGHWHQHADGQLVHVVDGRGFVGRRGQDPLEVAAGDLVWIEPGEEHWHGATADRHLAQLACSFGAITWLEPSR